MLVARLVIVHINNKATGMSKKFEPLETYLSEGFRWNLVEPVGIKPGIMQLCGSGTSSRYR